MELNLLWSRPIPMQNDRYYNLTYFLDFEKLPSAPGVYVFARRHGQAMEALYVGKAMDLRARIKSQLNNLKLMKHIATARTGSRILLAGQFVPKRAQSADKCIRIIERALIRHFLFKGHDLVNKQGTRLQRHEIMSAGDQPKRFIPRDMYAAKLTRI